MDKQERVLMGNKLKAAFNLLWDEALRINEQQGQAGTVSYRDIVRIADAIKAEGPKLMGMTHLPQSIHAGLAFAIAALDPNKVRAEETLKQGIAGLSGAGGLALVAVSLGQLLNPGVWAIVVAFFCGGVAGGPLAIVGISAGLLVAVGAVYTAFQRMSPHERSVKAHEYMMKGVDNWIEHGDSGRGLSSSQANQAINRNFAKYGLTVEDALAAATLMLEMAKADGVLAEKEQRHIYSILGNVGHETDMEESHALEHIGSLEQKKRDEIMSWCAGVAHADGVYEQSEENLLQWYCHAVDVDCDYIVANAQSSMKNSSKKKKWNPLGFIESGL